MLPDERAFWKGPMTQAWKAALPSLAKETVPILTGAVESIPKKTRDHLRNEWKTLTKREAILTGQEDFPDAKKDPQGYGHAYLNWSERTHAARQNDIVSQVHPVANSPAERAEHRIEIERLYRVAGKRWGKKGRSFLDAQLQGYNLTEASARAGVSRQTGDKYLKELLKATSLKKPTN